MLSSLSRRATVARTRVLAAAALATLVLATAACSDDDGGSGPLPVAADYELTGVASASAPQLFINPAGQTFTCGTNLTCEYKSGSITLNQNGTFQLALEGLQRPSSGAPGTGTDVSFISPAMQTGTWAQSGSTITFTPSASALGTFQGTLNGDNSELRISLKLSDGNTYILRFEQ